jgi:hypothetical protein
MKFTSEVSSIKAQKYDLSFDYIMSNPGVYERDDEHLYIISKPGFNHMKGVKIFLDRNGTYCETILETDKAKRSKYRKYNNKVTLTFEND